MNRTGYGMFNLLGMSDKKINLFLSSVGFDFSQFHTDYYFT